mmetsp:Transcript_28594/g.77149  ORF Transcript_28594/g.77149 Transcript_28594/m.77149 type:complete len:243 (+) Transcript_28594:2725-3453(+)
MLRLRSRRRSLELVGSISARDSIALGPTQPPVCVLKSSFGFFASVRSVSELLFFRADIRAAKPSTLARLSSVVCRSSLLTFGLCLITRAKAFSPRSSVLKAVYPEKESTLEDTNTSARTSFCTDSMSFLSTAVISSTSSTFRRKESCKMLLNILMPTVISTCSRMKALSEGTEALLFLMSSCSITVRVNTWCSLEMLCMLSICSTSSSRFTCALTACSASNRHHTRSTTRGDRQGKMVSSTA